MSEVGSMETGKSADKNIHGEILPEKYRFTEEDEKRLDDLDFYTHRGEVQLPPADITDADRFMAWRWYGQFMVPCTEERLSAMAWRISRERQLLATLSVTEGVDGWCNCRQLCACPAFPMGHCHYCNAHGARHSVSEGENMSKLPEPTPPTETQDEHEKHSCDTSKDVHNGFICGAWTKRQEGPILNIQTMARRTLVFRCDRPDGHKGQHVDHVLGTNFVNDESMPVAAPTERVETILLLDAMVRDFTELGRCSKSEVRRRIQEYALAVAAVAPSPAPASQPIVHEGFSTHRLRSNPLEQAYFDAWREQATHTLAWLLQDSSNNHFPEDYSARDAKVAATIIQWLGSPVGRCFVNEVLEKAGKP